MVIEESKVIEHDKVKLLVDNKSIKDLVNHLMSHGRNKYIKRKYHFLKNQMNKQKLELKYCKSKLQFSDMFTKPLKKARF